jgi:hypothetical protein
MQFMSDRIARFFSYLLHPMFIPIYGYSILLFTDNRFSYFFTLKVKMLLLAIVFTFTCLLPLINLLILRRLKLIQTIHIDEQKQRTFPYMVTTVFYFGMAYLIWDFSLPFIYKYLILAGALCIIVTTLINLRWKISAHMMGIGGLTGAAFMVSILLQKNFLIIICLLFACAGILGFSRLRLNSHTPAQIYVGYILGGFLTFLFLFLMYIVDLHSNLRTS